MKQIIIDTETTGRSVADHHRIIEIGAITLKNRQITQETFHAYLNPDRKNDPEAYAVHGLSDEFLSNQPHFSDVVSSFLNFVEGSELIIHNAPFDVSFFNYELQLIQKENKTLSDYCQITDSLLLARKLHPNQRNSLDALCKRYSVDNTHRTLHGALLDAQLLAQVYLKMTSGQPSLFEQMSVKKNISSSPKYALKELNLLVKRASSSEISAHQARLEAIKNVSGHCIWEGV